MPFTKGKNKPHRDKKTSKENAGVVHCPHSFLFVKLFLMFFSFNSCIISISDITAKKIQIVSVTRYQSSYSTFCCKSMQLKLHIKVKAVYKNKKNIILSLLILLLIHSTSHAALLTSAIDSIRPTMPSRILFFVFPKEQYPAIISTLFPTTSQLSKWLRYSVLQGLLLISSRRTSLSASCWQITEMRYCLK